MTVKLPLKEDGAKLEKVTITRESMSDSFGFGIGTCASDDKVRS